MAGVLFHTIRFDFAAACASEMEASPRKLDLRQVGEEGRLMKALKSILEHKGIDDIVKILPGDFSPEQASVLKVYAEICLLQMGQGAALMANDSQVSDALNGLVVDDCGAVFFDSPLPSPQHLNNYDAAMAKITMCKVVVAAHKAKGFTTLTVCYFSWPLIIFQALSFGAFNATAKRHMVTYSTELWESRKLVQSVGNGHSRIHSPVQAVAKLGKTKNERVKAIIKLVSALQGKVDSLLGPSRPRRQSSCQQNARRS